jgi:hypothetical protein
MEKKNMWYNMAKDYYSKMPMPKSLMNEFKGMVWRLSWKGLYVRTAELLKK